MSLTGCAANLGHSADFRSIFGICVQILGCIFVVMRRFWVVKNWQWLPVHAFVDGEPLQANRPHIRSEIITHGIVIEHNSAFFTAVMCNTINFVIVKKVKIQIYCDKLERRYF